MVRIRVKISGSGQSEAERQNRSGTFLCHPRKKNIAGEEASYLRVILIFLSCFVVRKWISIFPKMFEELVFHALNFSIWNIRYIQMDSEVDYIAGMVVEVSLNVLTLLYILYFYEKAAL